MSKFDVHFRTKDDKVPEPIRDLEADDPMIAAVEGEKLRPGLKVYFVRCLWPDSTWFSEGECEVCSQPVFSKDVDPFGIREGRVLHATCVEQPTK